MAAMTICTALVFLESTILPVAIPTIQKQINMGQSGLYWTINSYLLVLACFVYVGGRISDRFGSKKVFNLGMIVFGLASALAGFADHQAWMILGRSLQGFGSALMMPASMTIALNTLDENERGKGIGILVAVGSIFLSLGPFIGGYFAQYLSWRYVFLINIPVVLIGVFLSVLTVPNFKTCKVKFNLEGFLLFVGVLVFFTLTVMQVKVHGLLSFPVLIFFSLFILFSFLFLLKSKSNRDQFFDHSLFKIRLFSFGNTVVCIAQFLMMVTVFWSLFFQKILGYSPVLSGLLILIGTVPVIICAPISGYLSDNFGPKWPIIGGFALSTFSFIWLIIFPFSEYKDISIIGLVLFGCSMSIVMTPAGTATLSSVPSVKRGEASGLYLTLRNIASTLSVALLGCVISYGIQSEFKAHIEGYPGLNPQDYKNYVLTFLQGHSLSADFPSLSRDAVNQVRQVIKLSTVTAFFWVNVVCLGLSFLGFLIAVAYFSKNKIRASKAIKTN